MPSPVPLRLVELRGLVRLVAEATEGVTDIVEGVHQSVHGTLGFGERTAGRTGGLPGQVYRGIRALTRIAGSSADHALSLLDRRTDNMSPRQETAVDSRREALLAILNGVLGDRLAQNGNPLATPMTLRLGGRALDWSAPPAAAEVGSHVVVLLHGLCMNDLQWRSGSDGKVVDHGADLAAALGCTPLYLRYNSGRPIADNGRDFAAQLELLVRHWPVGIERLTLLGHSMGGLVARSAVHAAETNNLIWRERLREMVFLGTPHHGAPLERAGHWVTGLLQASPYSAPFARLALLRSAGITDLRHGWLHRDHALQAEPLIAGTDRREPLPLPDKVSCYSIAATLASGRGPLADRLTGDGLVPLRSALGQHDDPRHHLDIPPSRQWIASGTGHIALLGAPAVGQRLREWLSAD